MVEQAVGKGKQAQTAEKWHTNEWFRSCNFIMNIKKSIL